MKNKIQDLSREELEKLVLREKEKNARLKKRCAKLKKDVEWWENGEYYPLLESWRKIYKENEALKKEKAFLFKNFCEQEKELLEIKSLHEKAKASISDINELLRNISEKQDFMKQPFNYN